MARQLYGASGVVDSRIRGLGGKISARRTLEYHLKRWKLPPLCVRPLLVPRCFTKALGTLRRAVWNALAGVTNRWSKQWLAENLRVLPAKTQKWSEKANAKRVLSGCSLDLLREMSTEKLGSICDIPSLRAFSGPWRLSVWPRQRSVAATLRCSWHSWASQHRLPSKATCAGRGTLESFLTCNPVPNAPPQWAESEAALRTALSSGECRVLDDKLPNKIWTCSGVELFASMLSSISGDPMWRVHSQLDLGSLKIVAYMRSFAGLPHFLRSSVGRLASGKKPLSSGL